jgi:hypothetical protein
MRRQGLAPVTVWVGWRRRAPHRPQWYEFHRVKVHCPLVLSVSAEPLYLQSYVYVSLNVCHVNGCCCCKSQDALLDALQGDAGQAPQRVAVPGLIAAGTAAVDGLCEILKTASDDRILMFAADALAEAVPRDDKVNAAKSADALAVAVTRLESMVEVSPRLKAWADAASTEDDGAPTAVGIFARGRATERQQWQFAEDTALSSARVALTKLG